MKTKWTKQIIGVLALAGLSLSAVAAAASASLQDGDYTLTLPGVGEVEFSIADGTVSNVAVPEGYVLDDSDDEDEVELLSITDPKVEIEVKGNKVEAGVHWEDGDVVQLALAGGGSITVTYSAGMFTLGVPEGWYVFADDDGHEWYVSDTPFEDFLPSDDDDDHGELKAPEGAVVFKVEVEDDEIELKAVDEIDDDWADSDDDSRNEDDDSDDDDSDDDDHDDDDDDDDDDRDDDREDDDDHDEDDDD